ncbi:hypothetical protein MM326_13685 [Alkalihalobacillus sp. LMS6]|jgi:F420-0:gamma-glutamyl ligase|nr:hypothetical protein [Alkalihalobacillus sp. LMS6]UTR05159.1 hypothetical protein MM326_13685 [Alkalihalobacillus sp. LMS6]
MKMDDNVIKHAEEIAKWLKENANPHATVIITDSHVKLTSDEHGVPFK